jgi:hypothetical protein
MSHVDFNDTVPWAPSGRERVQPLAAEAATEIGANDIPDSSEIQFVELLIGALTFSICLVAIVATLTLLLAEWLA